MNDSRTAFASLRFAPLLRSVVLTAPAALLPVSALAGDDCVPDWAPIGSGPYVTNGQVWSLATYDDGVGPLLVASGFFTEAGGVPAEYIARFDGENWSALGGGLNALASALVPLGDGTLVAGGWFTMAGGATAKHVARWNGTQWSAMGGGLNNRVNALAVYDDGSGASPFAGGFFASTTPPGGTPVPVARIAKWTGTDWVQVGAGFNNVVSALAVFDDGNGPKLYAGGSFTASGLTSVSRVACWTGSEWVSLGAGFNDQVTALAVHGDPPALYAGGNFTFSGATAMNRVARWTGTQWVPVGGGMNGTVSALRSFDDGTGAALFAGGWFTSADRQPIQIVAKWNGSTWSQLGDGIDTAPKYSPHVLALQEYTAPSGVPALFVGGYFLDSPSGDIPLATWQMCAPRARDADLNGDGAVDGSDLAIVLGSWGSCTGCPADINEDGVVDGSDLALVLGSWTG